MNAIPETIPAIAIYFTVAIHNKGGDARISFIEPPAMKRIAIWRPLGGIWRTKPKKGTIHM
jgi:hypothetical protein